MIEAGTSKPAPFDVVVVHSFSCSFRDHFELEFYVRKLAKNGVKLVLITQEMGDNPMHVMRALKENARQGFWNGSLPHIGYRTVAAEERGTKTKKKTEIVTVPVPPIIDKETFEAVQKLLKARNPKVMPSRVISGQTILTGLIHCAKCGGTMTIHTGKGGRYRYYACSIKARQGPTACEDMAVPMDKLDNQVADHPEQQLLQPERLETVLAAALDRREEHAERRREYIAELNKRATNSNCASSASMTPSRRALPIWTTRR